MIGKFKIILITAILISSLIFISGCIDSYTGCYNNCININANTPGMWKCGGFCPNDKLENLCHNECNPN